MYLSSPQLKPCLTKGFVQTATFNSYYGNKKAIVTMYIYIKRYNLRFDLF